MTALLPSKRFACFFFFQMWPLAMKMTVVSQGRSQGGSWGARDPPFASLFLTKQPTTGGENAMTMSWPKLKSPFFETFFLIDMTIW